MSYGRDLDQYMRAAAEQLVDPGFLAVVFALCALVAIPAWLATTVDAPGVIVRALAAAGGHVELPADAEPTAPRDFVDAMAELTSGVSVVTAAGSDGRPCGLLATSLCSYSADPPSVLVCVGPNGRARAALLSASSFGVHVLADEQEDVARWFARPGADKFAAVDWEWDGGVPALTPDHVVAYLRCRRALVKRHGDHAIVIGEVDRVELADREPLVYRRRRMDWRLESASHA